MQRGGGDLREFFGEGGLFATEKCFAAEGEMIELIFEGGNDFGVAVTEGEDAISAEKIEEFAAIVVADYAPLGIGFDPESGKVHELC